MASYFHANFSGRDPDWLKALSTEEGMAFGVYRIRVTKL